MYNEVLNMLLFSRDFIDKQGGKPEEELSSSQKDANSASLQGHNHKYFPVPNCVCISMDFLRLRSQVTISTLTSLMSSIRTNLE